SAFPLSRWPPCLLKKRINHLANGFDYPCGSVEMNFVTALQFDIQPVRREERLGDMLRGFLLKNPLLVGICFRLLLPNRFCFFTGDKRDERNTAEREFLLFVLVQRLEFLRPPTQA